MAIRSTADKVANHQGLHPRWPLIELGAAIIDGELQNDAPVRLPLSMMNRHGLVAGATGTGKTVTLHMMAETLHGGGAGVPGRYQGRPVRAGHGRDRQPELLARTEGIGQAWSGKPFPVEFLPLAATVTASRSAPPSPPLARSRSPGSWTATRPRNRACNWSSISRTRTTSTY